MNLGQLKELLNQWIELFNADGAENWKKNAEEVEKEYYSRIAQAEEVTKIISVFYEEGYKWSVDVEGEDESRITGINKKDAMIFARNLKASFNGKAEIEAQVLSKQERKNNMKWLHEETLTYNTNNLY